MLQQNVRSGNQHVIDDNRNGSNAHTPGSCVVRSRQRAAKDRDFPLDSFRVQRGSFAEMRQAQATVAKTLVETPAHRGFHRSQSTGDSGIVNAEEPRGGCQRFPAIDGENVTKIIPIQGLHFCRRELQNYAFPPQSCRLKADLSSLWRSKMLYAVVFEDNLSLGPDIRRRHMPAHLAFLEKSTAQIKAAGPLRAVSGEAAGGLWIVETDSPEIVDALVKEDPFWTTGLRQAVRIFGWSQVFADGKRLI
jgi:uncharacterized protein YciI